jgi:hypothetical protein
MRLWPAYGAERLNAPKTTILKFESYALSFRARPSAEGRGSKSPESITPRRGYGFRARLRFAVPAIGPARGRARWAPWNDNLEVREHMIVFSESLH